jgi:hypothetical protein
MSDLLAIVDLTHTDEDLLAEIIRHHPDRVTVLVDDPDWAIDDSPRALALRDRLANLLAVIEARTGAVVVGLVASREQLRGWRFDWAIGGRQPLPAH